MKMMNNVNHQEVEVMNRKSVSLVMTGFLWSTPSCIEGLSRILDIGNTFNAYNVSSTPEEADARAIQSDWQVVGTDITSAVRQYQKANSDDRSSKK
ncbi:hypothetical protein [Armatimonas sp.]|uniref:hypothetical protein n=1 Tax=Armatimonas sp. TaxID=1872638 RepID=UPI003750D6D9